MAAAAPTTNLEPKEAAGAVDLALRQVQPEAGAAVEWGEMGNQKTLPLAARVWVAEEVQWAAQEALEQAQPAHLETAATEA